MDGLTYGQALVSLKEGRKVAREGWNGKGMWLVLVEEMELFVDGIMTPFKTKPFIAMKCVDGEIVPWLASQTDMLAEDWAEISV